MAKVLIFSQDVIGRAMAGPGIRCWEFAKALALQHEVTLAGPNVADVPSEPCRLVSYKHEPMAGLVRSNDVVITQHVSPVMAYLARRHGTRLIADCYDVVLLEILEMFRHQSLSKQRAKSLRHLADLQLALAVADGVICASQRQRDLWIGSLLAQGRITPRVYLEDPLLERLVAVVPFGVQDTAPEKTGEGFRGQFGIAKTDTVVVWGGGIWNWFDPVSVIRAMAEISSRRDDIKLVFMGLKHPNDIIPEMEMAVRAVRLAKELNLFGRSVFCNFDWVAYDERQNHLLEADIGISTHFNDAEARFAFRTRVLDYLWTELPVVTTEGGSTAELVASRELGIVVPYEDVAALVKAITSLADDRALVDRIRVNLEAIRAEYRWSKVVEPVLAMIDGGGERRPLAYFEVKRMVADYWYTFRDLHGESRGWPLVTASGWRPPS